MNSAGTGSGPDAATPSGRDAETRLFSLLLLMVAFMARALAAVGPTPAPGWSLELVAQAPQIRHPSVVCVAPDGRVFVAEDPMDISTRHADETAGRILCLHPDGRVTVFAEKLHAVFGMQYLRGYLYVLHNPKFSRFRDENGIGRDRAELIEQTNPEPWALDWNDHVPANFRLAMDGYFYVAVGDKGLYGAVDRSGRRVDLHGGGIVRIRPDGTGLEIMARGVRNILDVAVDAEDELFTYDNTDENQWMGRVSHMVDGGFYGYPFDFIPRRGYTLWMLADYGPGAACGVLAYNDDALPAAYQGNLFLADFGQRNVRRVILERAGGTFRAVRDELLFTDPPADFRPVGLHESPDGRGFYLCDWQHLDNKQEVTVGRLWKLTASFATNGAPVPAWYVPAAMGKPAGITVSDVIDGLSHPRKAVRLVAQQLAVGAGEPAAARLREVLVNQAAAPVARRHALWALDAIDQGSSARPAILALAAGPDPSLARQAMRQLGERRVAPAVPILVRRLADPDSSLRFYAATALGRIADPAAASGLLARLLTPEPELWPRYALWTALNRTGRAHPQVWPAVVRALDSTSREAAEAVGFALRESYEVPLVDALVVFLEDEHRTIGARLRALELLRAAHRQPPPWKGEWWSYHPFRLSPPAHTEDWSGTAKVSAALVRALRNASPEMQIAAVTAAGETRDRSALPGLRQLWRAGGSERLQRELLTALGRIGDTEFVPQLLAILRDSALSDAVREAAVQASGSLLTSLGEERDELTRALVDLMTSPGLAPPVHLALIEVSGRFALSNAAPALLSASRSGNAALREAGIRAVAALGAPLNLRALSDLATNGPVETRREALIALGELHDKAALPLLLNSARREETRAAASRALAAMPDAAALDVFLAGLSEADPVAKDRARRALKAVRLDVLSKLEQHTGVTPLLKAELRRIYENEPEVLRRPFLQGADVGPTPEDYARHALARPGDPRRGQALFFDEQRLACVRCHGVHGWGGNVGPEMTTAGAQFGRAALIESILYPSKTVREGYQQVELELRSGEILNGILKAESATEIILYEADGRQHRVAHGQIVARRNSALSLMPEGLQTALSLDEFADLVAYLEALKTDPTRLPPPRIPPGWQSLLKGGSSSWRAGAERAANADPRRHWRWNSDLLEQRSAGDPIWTAADFGDFTLRCEWRWISAPQFAEHSVLDRDGQPERGEAGMVLRERSLDCGEGGLLLRGWLPALVRLWARPEGSGALEPLRDAASSEAKRRFQPGQRADRPLGQWNEMEVTAQGDKISVSLNGARVLDAVSVPGLPTRGPIGILSGSGRIQVRALCLQERSQP